MKRGHSPFAMGRRQRIRSMLQVDHAGEYAAVKIYEGQMAVFAGLAHKREFHDRLGEMGSEERRHLEIFEELMVAYAARPSLLSPLWGAAGFALGAATALLSERAAMACTAAVEEVVGAHYHKQERELAAMGDEEALRGVIDELREDELGHRATALGADAERAFAYVPMTRLIQAGCRLAIRIAEKL